MAHSGSPHVVLVHGNPETSAIWEPLVAGLGRRGIEEVTTLSPPGFGAPLPHDFGARRLDYVRWLADEVGRLTAIGGRPVDIVGHDWGAGHVFGLAATHPGLVHSWAADCGGLLHPEYQWHDAAKMWQQPDVGEEVIAAMTATSLAERVEMFTGLGLPDDMAAAIAPAVDDDMGRAILALYRSALEPDLQALADQLAAVDHRPGAIITATDDPYVPAHFGGPVAERFGSTQIRLEGQGHWWMVSDPENAAEQLASFWNSL